MRRDASRVFGLLMVLAAATAGLLAAERGRGGIAAPDGSAVGKQWLFVVGIDKYQNWRAWPKLDSAVRDAKAVRDVLMRRYHIDQVEELYDRDATRAAIYGKLRWLGKNTKPNDSLMIYYAGHGQLDNFEGIGFWVPVDGTRDPATWLGSDRVRRAVANMPAKHVLLVSDSCFAGDFFKERSGIPKIDEVYYRRAYAKRSRQAMTSGGVEPVADASLRGHSPFAYWLLDALEKNQRPYLVPYKLFDEIVLGVTRNSRQTPRELVRRWRLLRTGEHLGMLRQVGRKIKPGFTIFPNSGRINDCLLIGRECDRLMFESVFSPGIACAGPPPQTEDVAIVVTSEPVEPESRVHRYELRDPTTWMEMRADIVLPAKAQAGKPTRIVVRISSVGASLQDEDAAEDFTLVLRCQDEVARLDLEPKGAIGGTGSSRKPRQPPATLQATWTPRRPGRYTISFGFRYTDDSHRETTLRPRLDVLTWGVLCRTHMANLLFARHMAAKPIYLNYEALSKGWENVQELALAEMAAFSAGGGLAGRGEPQANYRAFFKKHPDLFDGWTPTADAAVLYAYWGPNPLDTHKPWPRPTIADHLGATHRLFVALVDRFLPHEARALAPFRIIYLPSPSYEMSEAQLAALDDFQRAGGRVVLTAERVLINGASADERFTRSPRERPPTPTPAIAPSDGLRRNLRFALYRKGDRLALHAVNYNVCLLDPKKKVLEVPPTEVALPLPNGWRAVQATAYSPDAPPKSLDSEVANGTARFTLPRTRIYQIVVLEKKPPS